MLKNISRQRGSARRRGDSKIALGADTQDRPRSLGSPGADLTAGPRRLSTRRYPVPTQMGEMYAPTADLTKVTLSHAVRGPGAYGQDALGLVPLPRSGAQSDGAAVPPLVRTTRPRATRQAPGGANVDRS